MSEVDRATYLRTRYGKSQTFLNWREQRFVRSYLSRIGAPLPEVLDIPCGHGRFTPQLRAAATTRLVCADLAPEHMRALVGAESAEGAPIETVQADMFERFPFRDHEFDLVFSFRFFHHVRDEARRTHVVSELARVAKRFLIVSYYEDSSVHALQKKVWQREGHYRDLPLVPRDTMHGMFDERGFRVLEDRGVLPGIHAQRVALMERAA